MLKDKRRKEEKVNGGGVIVLDSMTIQSTDPNCLSHPCPPSAQRLPKLTHKEAISFSDAANMLGTKGESSADCHARCSSVRGNKAQEVRVGKRTGEDWETQKLSQTKAPPTFPAPTPSQPNHLLQPGGYGRGLARPQRPFLAEPSICSWREPRARPLLSEPAGALQ